MTTCTIKPMPEKFKAIKKKIYRPQHPPVFMDIDPGGLTPEDLELAIELFGCLDTESKEWWGGDHFLDRLKNWKIEIEGHACANGMSAGEVGPSKFFRDLYRDGGEPRATGSSQRERRRSDGTGKALRDAETEPGEVAVAE